jgi:hypothetical protein
MGPFFGCSVDFKMQKVYSSLLMRVYVVLITVSPGFRASYWSAGFGHFFRLSVFPFHWLEHCAILLPTPEENDQYSAIHS